MRGGGSRGGGGRGGYAVLASLHTPTSAAAVAASDQETFQNDEKPVEVAWFGVSGPKPLWWPGPQAPGAWAPSAWGPGPKPLEASAPNPGRS